jgi:hypothetical protein
VVVEFDDALFLHPFLGIGELTNCASDVELAGSQIASVEKRDAVSDCGDFPKWMLLQQE